MRLDVMSVMRGVDRFEELWQRGKSFSLPTGEAIQILALPDLVRSKKTQRDKDWPMIRRLIESDYVNAPDSSPDQINFWLRESRTPAMLVELVQGWKSEAEELCSFRPLLSTALNGDEFLVESELEKEQKSEREADRRYWQPLLRELESLCARGYDAIESVPDFPYALMRRDREPEEDI